MSLDTTTLHDSTEHMKKSLHKVVQSREQRWMSAEDKQEAVRTLQRHVHQAELALREPVAPGTQRAHDQLLIEAERAKGTLRPYGYPTDAA